MFTDREIISRHRGNIYREEERIVSLVKDEIVTKINAALEILGYEFDWGLRDESFIEDEPAFFSWLEETRMKKKQRTLLKEWYKELDELDRYMVEIYKYIWSLPNDN